MPSADIGLIGLAVMGENLALNIESRGFTVAVFNRTVARVDEFIQGRAAGQNVVGVHSLAELCGVLKKPRRVMLMVKAGTPVDDYIAQLLPCLEPGDIIIDGGNSNYEDSTRRTKHVESRGLLFIGTGVSGGEEGALRGPAVMPGGSEAAWPHVRPILQAIAARTADGTPCCDWVGPDGAGHFVKMVHNGIEYGDMQLICEAYHLMRAGLGLSLEEMSDIFNEWSRGELDSYLIEITRDILDYRDENGEAVLDFIEDVAGQKGTGRWTARAALETGQPLTLIGEAVFARFLSALREQRVAAAKVLTPVVGRFTGDVQAAVRDLRDALYASKITSYAQGFQLMRAVAGQNEWKLDYGNVALLWRAGCIIRSVFLERIKEAFTREPELVNLLLDPFFAEALMRAQPAWRRTLQTAIELGIPTPAMSAALAYFDGYRTERLPANLLQAQRDYFGAHTYTRIDRPGTFHTQWTAKPGRTS
ncbi:MAG: decarboxylating NADP(+)-dependent phosphogluconate dehydrogenase [Phycisphaerae bacterium]|jgi:6-phosphogluconate dehydrogenase